MKIASGVYRGCEIEFGLIVGTSGQCYVNVHFVDEKLQNIFKDIQEDLIRKTFGFPEKNGDNFQASINKEDSALAWTFFYECVGNCTKFEFLASIFRSIDNMIIYLPQPKKEEEPPSEESVPDNKVNE